MQYIVGLYPVFFPEKSLTALSVYLCLALFVMHMYIWAIVVQFRVVFLYREVIPEKGKLCRPALDCPEMAEMVYEARTLLQMILSSHSPQGPSDQQPLLTAVTESCCLAFRECFHAFYPSVPLKWFALCQQLQYLDPVSWWCTAGNLKRLRLLKISAFYVASSFMPISHTCK